MEFTYSYLGSSGVRNRGEGTAMSFVPDARREPTFFRGRLRKNIAFREAISALHDVVISDLRYQPKDKTHYKEWLERQEMVDWAAVSGQRAEVERLVAPLQRELNEVNQRISEQMSAYWRAQSSLYTYMYERDRNVWFVLDPVITVPPAEVFFECFSQDESSYGRLGASYEVFKDIGEFACGTTNVDYSSELYDEFQKIRSYKETDFEVDPSGFEVRTEGEEAHKEVKIDLPDTWVRGFLQVNSAMAMPSVRFDLHPMDVHNFCFVLRRNKEKKGPRSMRYVLRPGEPVRVIFEPWGLEVVCPRSIFKGEEAHEIRVWGRRRIQILERLIPAARRFTVHLLGQGMPSFYVADLGDMSFTLGLSGWTKNDWSTAGNFDLMAPRAAVDNMTMRRVFHGLKETWFEAPDRLASRLGLDRSVVLGALGAYTQAGRAIYDINKNVYRVRELSREPLPMDRLRFANEREQEATALVDQGKVTVLRADRTPEAALRLSGRVREGREELLPSLLIDPDERIIEAECSCYWHRQNKLYKGPCSHILALRMGHSRRSGRRP